jgi:hypothetical protein
MQVQWCCRRGVVVLGDLARVELIKLAQSCRCRLIYHAQSISTTTIGQIPVVLLATFSPCIGRVALSLSRTRARVCVISSVYCVRAVSALRTIEPELSLACLCVRLQNVHLWEQSLWDANMHTTGSGNQSLHDCKLVVEASVGASAQHWLPRSNVTGTLRYAPLHAPFVTVVLCGSTLSGLEIAESSMRKCLERLRSTAQSGRALPGVRCRPHRQGTWSNTFVAETDYTCACGYGRRVPLKYRVQ